MDGLVTQQKIWTKVNWKLVFTLKNRTVMVTHLLLQQIMTMAQYQYNSYYNTLLRWFHTIQQLLQHIIRMAQYQYTILITTHYYDGWYNTKQHIIYDGSIQYNTIFFSWWWGKQYNTTLSTWLQHYISMSIAILPAKASFRIPDVDTVDSPVAPCGGARE